MYLASLRWLNTVLRAVSVNARDSACFKLDKETWRRKSNGTQKTISCDIWQNFYFCCILSNENFKMEVEQMNFDTFNNYSIDYLKSHLLKFGQISFKW